ncbi:hypothetical protein ACTI_41720 [Actinoplanes sp. OR16]|uniref:hypothetical protein n=1 Tax=Actinoplanes sp. OR16 TaxID=946334 RepID=UPI000F6E225A|nr:hypothetical protein ACTI_41720 [Actinoplanes sp. OR16]
MVILLLLLLIGAGIGALVAGNRRGRAPRGDDVLADARAEARHWYERLGGQLVNLRADSDLARQALVDATERHQAAGGQLAQAQTVTQFRLARESALEGLAYVRAARIALGLDPGPELPPLASAQSVGSIAEEQDLGAYRVGPRPTPATPYYYPGGYQNGRPMPAGYYSTPWWKTALAAGAGTLGGMLLFDSLLGGIGHHHGGPGPFDGDFL